MDKITRRRALSASLMSSSIAVLGLPVGGQAAEPGATNLPLKIVVAGAHPDDPESAAGGTMARLADLGHEVVALYLTRGEAGIKGKTHDQAAAVRSAEAAEACRILKARPLFAGQIDGSTEIFPAHYDTYAKILMAEKPDIVFTHWPVDTHRDHRAVSLLTFDAWNKARRAFALYYFEVMTGSQTQLFHPTHYVDITATEDKKRAACFAHASQNPAEFYEAHTLMNQFRGREQGCKCAEAFVHHNQSKAMPLP